MWQVRGTYEFFMLLVLANGSMNSVAEVNEWRWVGGVEIDMLGKVHKLTMGDIF